MSTLGRVGDLEIDQDLEFQRRSWAVQRVGRVVVGLLVLAALLGLFGAGPLSGASAGREGDDLRLEYSRFGRLMSPMTLRVHLAESAARGDKVRLWLSRDYLAGVKVDQVMPEPDSVEAGKDRLTYTFSLTDPSASTEVAFHLEPQTFGPLPGEIGLENGSALGFRQFIYP